MKRAHITNEAVLVLNKYFLAIQVTDVKEAICAITTGKARIVDKNYVTYNLKEWVIYTKTYRNTKKEEMYSGLIRSPSIELFAPQVIIIPSCEFNNPAIKVVKYSRKNIYQRDDYTCQYCGKKIDRKSLTLDHIIPKSREGKSSWTNVVTCCIWCNSEKGDKLLNELGWSLKKQPKKPQWKSYIGIPFNKVRKEYWEQFLG